MSNEVTLREARAEFLKERPAGTHCPCCRRPAKEYPRSLNAGMARALMRLSRLDKEHPREWHTYQSFTTWEPWLSRTGYDGSAHADYNKLQYWNVIEKGPDREGWRITPRGHDFVAGRIQLPRVAVEWDGCFLRFEPGVTTIREALGNAFSFDEIMRPPLPACA